MSYTLTPIIVKISDLQATIGSNDTQLLQDVIAANTDEMIDVDALGEYFEDFESEIEAEYAAYSQGDFSYRHTIRPIPGSSDDDVLASADDPQYEVIKVIYQTLGVDPRGIGALSVSEANELKALLEAGDEAEKMSIFASFMQQWLDGGDDDEELDDEPIRELSTGGALADLILGREQDPAYGYKYGYALEMLCEHLGQRPFHDSWCTIRSAAFDAIDETLVRLGVPAAEFSTQNAFVSRGAPVAIPKPNDFPFMGYLTNAEIAALTDKLDKTRIENLPAGEDDDEWEKEALGELVAWLELAMKNNSDLLTFYS